MRISGRNYHNTTLIHCASFRNLRTFTHLIPKWHTPYSSIAIFLQFCLCASRQYVVVLPSDFCGLWLVLILKLNGVRKQIPAAFKWLYKYFTSYSIVFIENSTFTVIIKLLHHWETPVQMVCLYNTSDCSFSVLFRPLFSLKAAVSVFASTSSTSMFLNKSSSTNIKIWHFITKWLFGLHSCVIFNSFYRNKEYKTCRKFQITRDKIIYLQVERIVILIRRGLISLQFYLSL